jgi:hypothetical protein
MKAFHRLCSDAIEHLVGTPNDWHDADVLINAGAPRAFPAKS